MAAKKKIAIATSTRADWGLLRRVALQLSQRADVELQIVATNMHLDVRRGHTVDEIIADGFDVAARVEMFAADDTPEDSGASAARAMGRCATGMADAFAALAPDMLVALGDRFEMLATAAVAAVMRIPIAHISGGETTLGAIDDNIRHAITQLSQLHFPTTELHRDRIIAMGKDPATVHNVGALGVENIIAEPQISREELETSLGFALPSPSILVTYHPATAADGDPCEKFAALLAAIERSDVFALFTYPNNDPRSAGLIEMIEAYVAAHPGRAAAVPSLGRRRYLGALRCIDAVVGNSSSGIVEVPSMGIPTVDVGPRQQGRTAAASVIHCDEIEQSIASAIATALSDECRQRASHVENPYSRPGTSAAIADKIIEYLDNR